MEERCIICGRIIPEGRQVCPICEKEVKERSDSAMKIIFLDIDGVLNNHETRTTTSDGWCFVDDELVARLKKIVDATDAKIVLSSTWLEGWHREDETLNDISFTELRSKFKEFGLSIMSRTCDSWEHSNRGDEIQEFLDKREDIESFIILDDWNDVGMLVNRLVFIDSKFGLTDENVQEAINMLNTPNPNVTLWDVVRTTPREVLERKPITIMYRCNYPKRLLHLLDAHEILDGLYVGYCSWDGKNLVSKDGDEYFLNDVIYKYERNLLTDDLVVWQETEWADDE